MSAIRQRSTLPATGMVDWQARVALPGLVLFKGRRLRYMARRAPWVVQGPYIGLGRRELLLWGTGSGLHVRKEGAISWHWCGSRGTLSLSTRHASRRLTVDSSLGMTISTNAKKRRDGSQGDAEETVWSPACAGRRMHRLNQECALEWGEDFTSNG